MEPTELRRPELPKPRRSMLSILLAFALLVVTSVVLSFLTLGSFGPVIAIGGIIFLVIGFHYVIWGWWLGKIIQDEERELDDHGND